MPTAPLHIWDRFWPKVDTSGGLLACWPWRGAQSQKRQGYTRGIVREAGKGSRILIAHRVALCLAGNGLEEYGRPEQASHRCHNRLCCNTYSHLYWGTDEDNREDRRRLETRQAQGFPVWDPQAWFWCNRCLSQFLAEYAPPGSFPRPGCPTCGCQTVFSLVDLEYAHAPSTPALQAHAQPEQTDPRCSTTVADGR